MADYIIGIDQSTQGTKALLLDQEGTILCRTDKSHAQIINDQGWVEHDPEEIYRNTLKTVKALLEKSKADPKEIRAVGISNQRETALAWNRKTGKPVYNAIVWQCARGAAICERLEKKGIAPLVKEHTGLQLSPYFSAAKLAWIMENVEGVKEEAQTGNLCCGTVDSWLVFKLTCGKEFRTDYSNASRTQLFDIRNLCWDQELCALFGIPENALAELTDSDSLFGETDFEGILPKKIPIHGVLGDSHGALFGQGCLSKGMMKTTYGTGSSIMMNIGEDLIQTDTGLVTSLAWKMNGKAQYVLEGNINDTGAVITWMKDKLGLIEKAADSETFAKEANPADHTYLVPAFSGLGAPYWRSDVSAVFAGMSRTTGKAELVKAGLESIVYQITDIVELMKEAAKIQEVELRVDGGPTRNQWLMQFQSDILNCKVQVPKAEELSGMGAAYAAGLGVGVYTEEIFRHRQDQSFTPQMESEKREEKYSGWKKAVSMVLGA